MFRKYTDEDLTDEALGGPSEVIDYKTKDEQEDDYLNVEEGIKSQLLIGEEILWEGRPDIEGYRANAYIALKIVAAIFAVVDGILMTAFFIAFKSIIVKMILLVFFAVHLTPVWIYLATCAQRKDIERSIYYVLTNKRVIVGYSREIVGTYLSSINKVECYPVYSERDIGTIRFYKQGDMQNDNKTVVGHAGIVDYQSFIAIENFTKVREMINQILQNEDFEEHIVDFED